MRAVEARGEVVEARYMFLFFLNHIICNSDFILRYCPRLTDSGELGYSRQERKGTEFSAIGRGPTKADATQVEEFRRTSTRGPWSPSLWTSAFSLPGDGKKGQRGGAGAGDCEFATSQPLLYTIIGSPRTSRLRQHMIQRRAFADDCLRWASRHTKTTQRISGNCTKYKVGFHDS